MRSADVLVVGAGPAGLATAISLVRRGVSARVVERRRGPLLDKACGEGIMPAGVRALEALGVRLSDLPSARFHGVRFVEAGLWIEGRFARGFGLGIRRRELSRALLQRAREVGVEVAFGCGLSAFEAEGGGGVIARTTGGQIRARLLVGADGLGSAVRARAGLAMRARPDLVRSDLVRPRRFGLRRHFRLAPWSSQVEVHWQRDREAYVTPVAPDEVGVAILGAGSGRDYAAELASFPELARRLAGAEPTSDVCGAGPFWQRARARTAEGVALVGDAAGYTDAVTGEGITLALLAGEALAQRFAACGSTRGYESDWRRLTRDHRAFAALLGFGVAHPRARRVAFQVLARRPALFEALLRRTALENGPPAAGDVSDPEADRAAFARRARRAAAPRHTQ